MLSAIVQFISLSIETMSSTCLTIFLISASVGKAILEICIFLNSITFLVAYQTLQFTAVLVDSLLFFFQDISIFVQQVLGLMNNYGEYVFKTVLFLPNLLFHLINNIVRNLVNFYYMILSSIAFAGETILGLFVLTKRLIVLLGSGIWFAITIFPLTIFYSLTMLTYCIGRMFEEILSFLLHCERSFKEIVYNLVIFITDVPLEATLGLITGGCLIYIFIHFYLVITAFLYEKLRYVIFKFKHYFNVSINFVKQFLERRFHRIVEPRRQIRITRRIQDHRRGRQLFMDFEKYCVICQEREKCILILPCRHICLCSECNYQLELYNRTCPICREEIENSMKVYL